MKLTKNKQNKTPFQLKVAKYNPEQIVSIIYQTIPGIVHDLTPALPYEVVSPMQNQITSNYPIPKMKFTKKIFTISLYNNGITS